MVAHSRDSSPAEVGIDPGKSLTSQATWVYEHQISKSPCLKQDPQYLKDTIVISGLHMHAKYMCTYTNMHTHT